MKILKILVFLLVVSFSLFFFLGFLLYAIYYIYSKNKENIRERLEDYPEAAMFFRKLASFVSILMAEKEVSEQWSVQPDEPLVHKAKKRNYDQLSSRQVQILDIVKIQGKADMSEIKNSFPKVHVRTIRRDLSKLEDLNYINKKGRTKGVFYTLR